ncbi:MAG: ABC transporter permease [Candidatus Heimdallarchaeota archaeon]
MEEQYQNLTQYEKQFKFGPRFGALYRLYFSKLWNVMVKEKRTWLFNMIMFSPIIAGPIIAIINMVNNGYMSTQEFFGYYSDIMFQGYIGIILPLFTMYVASMLFNDEKNNRSITYLTVRPIHKFELVLVKYLSYLSLVPLFTILSSGLIYVSFAAFGYFEYFTMFLWYLLAAVISSAVYGAVFMAIGLLFKNPLWFGLAFVLIWEFVFASFSDLLGSLTVAYYIKSLIVYDVTGDPNFMVGNTVFVINPAEPLVFSLVFAMIIIISITLSWSLLNGDKFRIPYQAGRRPGGWKYYLKEIRSFMITFGIIFIIAGIVVGPINGLTKAQTRTLQDGESFKPDPQLDEFEIYDLESMGFAVPMSYAFTKGDDIDVSWDFDYDNYYGEDPMVEAYGIVVTQTAWNSFVDDAIDLWTYYDTIYNRGNSIIFDTQKRAFLNEFSVMTALFRSEQAVYDEHLTTGYDNITAIKINQRINYILAVIIEDYDIVENQNLGYDVEIKIDGIVARTGGYVSGWVLVGSGIIFMAIATYSIVTYKSADEIKRYEEHISLFEEREEQRLATKEENNND